MNFYSRKMLGNKRIFAKGANSEIRTLYSDKITEGKDSKSDYMLRKRKRKFGISRLETYKNRGIL